MTRRSTILLVEDSADDVFLFERALRDGGQDYDVHVTRSGEEAIEYLQRACQGGEPATYPVPRFIIMDNKMTGMDGADFLLWVSKHPLCRVIPTVVLSGSDQPSEVRLAFDRGVHGYFVKPHGKSELVELMKMIFYYWAQSSVPPVNEYEVTARGEQPVLKNSRRA